MSTASVSGAAPPQIRSGASPPMSSQQKMGNLFNQMDANGTGTVTKTDLEQAFQTQQVPSGFKKMGADGLYAQLDPNNTGSVSKQDFVNTMQILMQQIRGEQRPGNNNASQAESSSSASEAANNGQTKTATPY